jgi:RHS repeat-associated protein
LGGRVFGPLPDNPAGDTGFDGDYGAGDSSAISGWAMAGDPYRAYADVDLDGDIDGTDATYSTNVGLGWDELSRDGSTIGYAGYVQDDFISTLSHVRHRVYKSDLGRWVQRDPLGYIDGPNVYEYAMSRPHILIDPMGLASQTGGCGLGGAGGVGVDSCGGRVGAVLGWWKKPVKKLTSCLECAQQLREAAENMDFNSEQCIGCCDTYACRSCRSDPWVPRPGDTHAECVSDCSICCHKWKCVGINDLWRRLPDCIECALDIDDDRFEEYFEGDIARCHPDQFGQELRCGPLLRAKLLRCKDRKAWETGCD